MPQGLWSKSIRLLAGSDPVVLVRIVIGVRSTLAPKWRPNVLVKVESRAFSYLESTLIDNHQRPRVGNCVESRCGEDCINGCSC